MRHPRRQARATTAHLRKVGEYRLPGAQEGDAWKRDAYAFAHSIGEVGYLLDLTANTVSACELRLEETPTEMQERAAAIDGENAEAQIESNPDPRATRVMTAFTGPVGGQSELLRRAAMHMQIGGESFLVGTPGQYEHDGILWEFLSSLEIRVDAMGRVKRDAYGRSLAANEKDAHLPIDAYIARLWRPDSAFSERSSSALRRVLDICYELQALTRVVDAITRTRMSNGVFIVPEELSFGPEDETEEVDGTTDDIDPLTEALLEHMSAPIEDRASAASLVPLILRAPGEFIDKIKHIEVGAKLDSLYLQLREEAIQRLAQGMDAPPELMSGKGGLNHWTGYSVDADFNSRHVIPLGEMIAEFITTAYLRPMLIEFEEMTEHDAERFRVVFDASNITARQDRATSAVALYDRIELSGAALRRSTGFDESDAPDAEEVAERLKRQLVAAHPDMFPQLLDDIGVIDVQEIPGPGEGMGSPSEGPDSPSALPGLPTGPESPGGDEPGLSEQLSGYSPEFDGRIVTRLTTAADGALDRALERAANRVISKSKGAPENVRDRLAQARGIEVLSITTTTDLRTMGLKSDVLLDGAWDQFALKARGWVAAHLRERGQDPLLASDNAARAVSEMCQALTVLGGDLLVLGVPKGCGPNGLRVPDQIAVDALSLITLTRV